MDRQTNAHGSSKPRPRANRVAAILALFTAALSTCAPAAFGAGHRVGAGAGIPTAFISGVAHHGIPQGSLISPNTPAPYRREVVLVGFRSDVTPARRNALAHAAGATAARRLGPQLKPTHGAGAQRLTSPFELRVRSGQVLSVIGRLRRNPAVAYAEPDYLMRASAAPSDPGFPLQWGASNIGQLIPFQESEEVLGAPLAGTPGADAGLLKAWQVSTGSRSIVIGEPDSGVDYKHSDLAANVWSNPGGIGGCAAGTHGYNVLARSCNPMDEDGTYGGHGTHVAGIMGAVGNNGIGVAGTNWRTSILPVKWLSSAGWGETGALIEALQWLVAAKQEGVNVRVVNDSDTFWGTAYSQALSDAIDTLGANNILFIASAGNTGNNNDEVAVQRYPCSYDRPNEICVTASNSEDLLPSWANYGPHTVDLAAPGVSIYSTLRNNTYGYLSGGSMAAPQVAGAAALILSVAPSMSATALKADILGNVDQLPSLSGRVISGGRLNVCRALPGCGTQPPPAPVPVNEAPPSVSGIAQTGQTLTASTGSFSEAPTSYAYQWQRCDTSGANCAAIAGASSQTRVLGASDVRSTLRVAVTASNAAGPSAPAESAQTAVVRQSSATFGQSRVGARWGAIPANVKAVNSYSLSTAGTVTRLSVYLSPTGASGHQPLRGVLYADAGSSPGALLATSSQLTFSRSQGPAWYGLVFQNPPRLGPGRYWIGIIAGRSANVAGLRYEEVSGSGYLNANPYGEGPTDPFGPGRSDNLQISLYATYLVG